MFDTFISTLTIDQEVADLYLDIIKEQYGADKAIRSRKITKLTNEIAALQATIESAEDDLFEGKIDIATFEKGKARYGQKISDLTFELEEIKQVGANFITHITKCLSVFKNLLSFKELGSQTDDFGFDVFQKIDF